MVEDFDVVEVCCKTVVACVESEVCDCMVYGFVLVIFPRGFDLYCSVYYRFELSTKSTYT
jgi:hypothetical protein